MYQEITTMLLPEVFVIFMASVILLFDVFTKNKYSFVIYALSLFSMIGALYLSIISFSETKLVGFGGALVHDHFSALVKIFMYLIVSVIWFYGRNYIIARGLMHGEYFALSMLSLLGMMLAVSSGNFLTLYLGMELFALPLYALIVLVKNQKLYTEAAMKYFIIGALGAALILYGISMIYGVTGSLDFAAIGYTSKFTLKMGMVLIIAGLFLEFGVVPFHMWLPDVYEGSPTVITMFIATLPKLAVFALCYRMFSVAFAGLTANWQLLLTIGAVLSVVLGNLAAMVQTNFKRMLAFSAISHIAFVLMALLVGPQHGYNAAVYYIVIYVLMTLAAFGMIIRISKLGFEGDKIQDFRGLNVRNPWLAFMLLMVMLSLAGVPPFVGFYAKLLVIQGLVASGYQWLAVLSLIMSVVGAYYYLRVVRIMYFDSQTPSQINVSNEGMSLAANMLLMINCFGLLILGIFPAPLMYICEIATQV